MPRLIWLASYPKSGNTWVRLFLSTLRSGRDIDLSSSDDWAPIASSRTMLEYHLDISLTNLTPDEIAELRPLAYRALAAAPPHDEILAVKTHNMFALTPSGGSMFPREASSGCVQIVRDPRDLCLSLAAHDGISVDAAIARMAGIGPVTAASMGPGRNQVTERRGSWSSHAESWLAAPMPHLLVRYEDMVAEPFGQLGAIARFCGFTASEDLIAAAVAKTSFVELARQEEAGGFVERPDGMERFFRVGRAGQWHKALAPDQISRIEADHGMVMRRLGYTLSSEPAGAAVSRSCRDANG